MHGFNRKPQGIHKVISQRIWTCLEGFGQVLRTDMDGFFKGDEIESKIKKEEDEQLKERSKEDYWIIFSGTMLKLQGLANCYLYITIKILT